MTVAGFRDKDIYVIESLKYDIYQLSIHPSILQLPIVLWTQIIAVPIIKDNKK